MNWHGEVRSNQEMSAVQLIIFKAGKLQDSGVKPAISRYQEAYSALRLSLLRFHFELSFHVSFNLN